MHEQFIIRTFQPETQLVIDRANTIIAEYQSAGFVLTLRQLYYQFVARDLLANTPQSYDRLGSIINDGRMAGDIDWAAIEDRTRSLRDYLTFHTPADAVRYAAERYLEPVWDNQPCYIEVWPEKDALVGVVEPACNRWRVPYFACRGYVSQSAMYEAGKRLADRVDRGQQVIILHLGDHDPSGIDMTRDVTERLHLMSFGMVPPGDEPDEGLLSQIEVHRIALNMDQVRRYNPPPNPTKESDGRSGFKKDGSVTPGSYGDLYGRSSWELDALDPKVIDQLIDNEVRRHLDDDRWDEDIAAEKANRKIMNTKADDIEKEQDGE